MKSVLTKDSLIAKSKPNLMGLVIMVAIVAVVIFAMFTSGSFSIVLLLMSLFLVWITYMTMLSSYKGHQNIKNDDFEIYYDKVVDKRMKRRKKGSNSYRLYFENFHQGLGSPVDSTEYHHAEIGDYYYIVKTTFSGNAFTAWTYPANKYDLSPELKNKIIENYN